MSYNPGATWPRLSHNSETLQPPPRIEDNDAKKNRRQIAVLNGRCFTEYMLENGCDLQERRR